MIAKIVSHNHLIINIIRLYFEHDLEHKQILNLGFAQHLSLYMYMQEL